MSVNNPRTLVYDIETAPDVGYAWKKWDTQLLGFKEHWYMLSFAWKWLDEKKTHVLALPDFPSYADDPTNDYELVFRLWELFDKADITVTHNGRQFDRPKAQARMIYHGMTPPSPHKEIDTHLIARKEFAFTSNSLADLAEYLGLEAQKGDPGTFRTWLAVMAGNKKAWSRMKQYNKQDVVVTEQLYLRLRPWITGHPNMNLYNERPDTCPICGAKDSLIRRGFRYYGVTKRIRYQCTICQSYSLDRSTIKTTTQYVPN